ncbi:MAG TPA: nucleoside triphosphate pyrophosphohydrolase [Candidatus Krumholzibacteria bacterium]|nr:nucleoside triphosphate pyrophosphohydrolase [Candidatus Krumholzibacteria bacterium]
MAPKPEGVGSIETLDQLLETLRFLRSEHGCPWDRAQSLEAMCTYLIDEAYELQDAAHAAQDDACAEELGDVLFLLLSVALMLQERGGPEVGEIARRTREKIIRRHPHVFGALQAQSAEEGARHWRDIKDAEARARGEAAPLLLDTLPRSLPPLRRALTVQRRVAAVGFEWDTAEQVRQKIVEETAELQEVVQSGEKSRITDELGDILFSVVNLGRFLGVDPEAALHSTVSKFVQRFGRVEEALRAQGRSLEEATLPEMDGLWEEAKRHETGPSGTTGGA